MDFFTKINIPMQKIKKDLRYQRSYLKQHKYTTNIRKYIIHDQELIDLKKAPQDYQLWSDTTVINYSWNKYLLTRNHKWIDLMNTAQVGTYDTEKLEVPAYVVKSGVLADLAFKYYPHYPLSTDDTDSANTDALFNNLIKFNKVSKKQDVYLRSAERRINNKYLK